MRCRHELSIVSATQSIINIHDTQGVGESGARLPAGDDDDRVAALDEAARLSELNTELNAVVDVLHPVAVNGFCK